MGRPSDSTVSEDAGIECRTVATLALTARRSNHWARFHKKTKSQIRILELSGILLFTNETTFDNGQYQCGLVNF